MMWQQVSSFLILVSFAGLLTFCAVSFMAMDMTQAGACVMVSHSVMCPMDLQKQLAFWQHVMVEASWRSVLVLSLLATAVIFSDAGVQRLMARARQTYLQYVFRCTNIVFDYLLAQFAQGILQPKIY